MGFQLTPMDMEQIYEFIQEFWKKIFWSQNHKKNAIVNFFYSFI